MPQTRRILPITGPPAVATVAASYAIFASGLTLLGWAIDRPRLTDWTNEGISMFPNAAVCGMFIGGAVILLASSSRLSNINSARILAGLALGVGGLVIFEHITGVNVGIDTLLFNKSWGQAAAAAPMRMGPPASASYVVLGTAVILTTFGPQARILAALLAIGGAVIASLSLTGYILGADQLFGIARFTGIAFLTSSVVAALSVGVMALVPDHGVFAMLSRQDPGGSVFRRLVVPVLLVPLLLGWLRITGQRAGLYDTEFGTALRTLAEIVLFLMLLWWTANSVSWHANFAKTAESRLAAIIECSDDAIISMSLDGIIRSWNLGAQHTFGYFATETLGKHISLLIPPDRINEEDAILGRIKCGERVEHYETVRVRRDGTRISVSLTVSPIKNSNGQISGASKIARDMTNRKRTEERLARSSKPPPSA